MKEEKITAIVVDDSRMEISNLMECINWERVGIEVCGTALNGKASLSLYKKCVRIW